MLYVLPVLLLEKLLQVTISAQHVQRLQLQGELPVPGGWAGVVILVQTKRSLKFRGHLEVTRGGVGRAFWSFCNVCKMGNVSLLQIGEGGVVGDV